jgi:pimeloyl-ACP methyl ester carboxylesterase
MARNWVLVRGIVSEEFHWWHLPDLLSDRFPGDVICGADILGNGKNHHRATPISINANVQGLRNQVPQNGKKIIVGFSLGAMLALEWAYAFPSEVEAIVMINASLNRSPLHHRLTPGAFRHIIKASLERDLVKREEMLLRLTTGLNDQRINEIAPIWGGRSEIYPQSVKNFLLQLILAARVPQRKKAPEVPILVLNSFNDRVVDPRCSARLAEQWNLPLKVHPHAGHDLTLEDPHWVLDHIADWMQRILPETYYNIPNSHRSMDGEI